jgi:hypothetical protein
MRGSTASHTRPRLTTVALVALVAAVNGARVGMLWPRLWGLSAAQEEAGCSSRPAHPQPTAAFPRVKQHPGPLRPASGGRGGRGERGQRRINIAISPHYCWAGGDGHGGLWGVSFALPVSQVRSPVIQISYPSSFDQRFVSATPVVVSGTLWRSLGLAATPPLPPSSSRCCLARTARPAAAST